jgi:hypothetical protein
MVRADRNYPSVYFGRPGSLVTLPYPRGDMDKGFERLNYDFTTGTGQHVVSTMVGGSRPYTLAWNALHVDNYALLEQYWTGMMGQGPWAFVDPSTTNMLLPNQASATNLFGDTRHFSINFLGALSSNTNTAHIHRTGATRSLRWLFASAPGASFPVITLAAPYRSWYGFPVVPGLPYQWSGWLKPDGTVETSITVALKLQWVGPTGTQLSEISGGDVVTTAWTRHMCGGVAPPGAAYARLVVVVTGSSVLAGGSLYLDELLLEQDTVVNNWAPGTGSPRPVEILSLPDTVPFNTRFRKGVTMTLRELAP